MNKKWFGFNIFMIIFSSIMTFLYFVALFVSPFIMIPGISKELMTIAILVGIFIGTAMMYFAVKSLYRNGTKVRIIDDETLEKVNGTIYPVQTGWELTNSEQTKTDLNSEENKKI